MINVVFGVMVFFEKGATFVPQIAATLKKQKTNVYYLDNIEKRSKNFSLNLPRRVYFFSSIENIVVVFFQVV